MVRVERKGRGDRGGCAPLAYGVIHVPQNTTGTRTQKNNLKSPPRCNMSDRFEEYQCRYCGFKTKTSAQLSSHISQSPACLDKIIADNQLTADLRKRDRSPTPGDGSYPDDHQQEDNLDLLYSSLLKGQPSMKRARIEVEEDIPVKMHNVIDEFEPPAGEPRPKPPGTSNSFERFRASQQASGNEPWAPFSSVEDWDYARWIMNSGLSQREIDNMLRLDLVSEIFYIADGIVTHRDSVEVCRPILP